MRINTNLTAMNTYTQYTKNNSKISSAVAKLSSGYSINSAADNAAGLAISEKMRAQIRGLNQASTNSQDAISLTQTAEGALSSSTEILQRMREISVQSSNDTNNTKVDREALQDEFSQLQNELNDIASTTSFNKKNLLDGSLATTQKSVTNAALANKSMAVSVGNAAAGNYSFQVVTKQETATVDAVTATGTTSMNSTAKATFTSATASSPSTSGALYNGNYTLSAKANDDGSMTVTATGDNKQTFAANVSSASLSALTGGTGNLTLNFASSSSANDGFTLTLATSSAISTSSNGLDSLGSAIGGVTVSMDGGVDKQDATFGAYATLTGGESVKLAAGDTSVTFDNGVKVGFDKLSSTDVATNVTAATNTTYTQQITSTKALAATDTIKVGSNTFTVGTDVAAADVNTAGKLGAFIAGKINADSTLASGYTASADNSGKITYTANASGTNAATWAAPTVTITAVDTINNSDAAAATATAGVTGTDATASLSTGMNTKLGDGAANAASTFQVADSKGAGLTFQVGANEGDELTINIDKMDAQYLGVASAKVTTQKAASAAITTVDNAINQVSSQRAYLGAIQNRLDYKISNLNTSSQNMTSAESQIRDVDMAKEMTEFTNANILSQAATSMLAQANSLPQNVLSLLK
jgi:flagellin